VRDDPVTHERQEDLPTLEMGRRPDDTDPVEVFRQMVEAYRRRDHGEKVRCRKQLYRLGWSCCETAKGGRL